MFPYSVYLHKEKKRYVQTEGQATRREEAKPYPHTGSSPVPFLAPLVPRDTGAAQDTLVYGTRYSPNEQNTDRFLLLCCNGFPLRNMSSFLACFLPTLFDRLVCPYTDLGKCFVVYFHFSLWCVDVIEVSRVAYVLYVVYVVLYNFMFDIECLL